MEFEDLKDRAVQETEALLSDLAASKEKRDRKKAFLLAYWINDYIGMIHSEREFNPMKRMKYHRGQIVKAHLGFRIGNEEGGLHYGIVIDKDNSLSSGVITIVPLTSVKPNKPIHWTSVPLGNEVYSLLNRKCKKSQKELQDYDRELDKRFAEIQKQLDSDESLSDSSAASISKELDSIQVMLEETDKKLDFLDKSIHELNKMKKGSVALVGQITTISKQRIYNPRFSQDTFGGVRVSNATLDQIDQKIVQLYLNSSIKR